MTTQIVSGTNPIEFKTAMDAFFAAHPALVATDIQIVNIYQYPLKIQVLIIWS